jgi:hypothetical protein
MELLKPIFDDPLRGCGNIEKDGKITVVSQKGNVTVTARGVTEHVWPLPYQCGEIGHMARN